MQAVQIDLNRQIHAPLAAEGTEDGDGLSSNAVGAGRNVARAEVLYHGRAAMSPQGEQKTNIRNRRL
jgi:hypothetical protein